MTLCFTASAVTAATITATTTGFSVAICARSRDIYLPAYPTCISPQLQTSKYPSTRITVVLQRNRPGMHAEEGERAEGTAANRNGMGIEQKCVSHSRKKEREREISLCLTITTRRLSFRVSLSYICLHIKRHKSFNSE